MIQCDVCECLFDKRHIDIKNRVDKLNGVVINVSSFYCPECKEEYIVNITDLSIRKLQVEYRKLAHKIKVERAKNKPSESRMVKLNKKAEELKETILTKQNKLISVYIDKYSGTAPKKADKGE